MSSTPPPVIQWFHRRGFWGRTGVVFVLTAAMSLILLAEPELMYGFAVMLGAVLVWWLIVTPSMKQKSCLFCGDKDALPMPQPNVADRPWWEPLRKQDVAFVCEPHLQNYLVMYAKMSD